MFGTAEAGFDASRGQNLDDPKESEKWARSPRNWLEVASRGSDLEEHRCYWDYILRLAWVPPAGPRPAWLVTAEFGSAAVNIVVTCRRFAEAVLAQLLAHGRIASAGSTATRSQRFMPRF